MIRLQRRSDVTAIIRNGKSFTRDSYRSKAVWGAKA